MNDEFKKQLVALREKTKAGITDCKKALEKFLNFEEALNYLYEIGLVKAAKREGNVANEGAIITKQNDSFIVAMIWNTETDFVAKNDEFCEFVEKNAKLYLENFAYINSEEFENSRKQIAAQLGENIVLSSHFAWPISDNIFVYNHLKINEKFKDISKVFAYVKLAGNYTKELGNSIAEHIAAYKPLDMKISENVSKEDALMEQKFLYEQSLTMHEFLKKNSIEISEFKVFVI